MSDNHDTDDSTDDESPPDLSFEAVQSAMPSAVEYAETVFDPDQAAAGLYIVDGEDLPDDRELGRKVRVNITTPGSYVKRGPAYNPRKLVVVDQSRPELVPGELTDQTGDARAEFIAGLATEITLNLLNAGDPAELGQMVRERLVEQGKVYDADAGESIPGYYDPADDREARPGEEKAYVVIGGS